jgi:hypothetical protein
MNLNISEMRSAILNEHNRLRTDPSSFITFLEEHIKNISNEILSLPNQRPIKLREGIRAYKNAIEFLRKQKPVKALTFDSNLAKASQKFADYLGKNGAISNIDSNGQGVAERIEEYVQWDKCCAENIEYGSLNSRDIIISLLVDDGVDGKGHRKNLFSKELKYVGIGISEHSLSKLCAVIDYAGDLLEKGESFYDISVCKENAINNVKNRELNKIFQYSDPARTKSEKTKFKTEILDNKILRKITTKIYELDDGSQNIIETEELIDFSDKSEK